ncbi:unnamed protein product [Notodromas monacha]|uniref:TOG domain-containing protein n=1 Tax=Notodromas monacha TaxID=399045 RepID=A0A7R9BET3_9CRUS|nr:unnamed protein product [Notodromas monacha]CAG0914035.1 unnamed protein product [Notodromas monacha]
MPAEDDVWRGVSPVLSVSGPRLASGVSMSSPETSPLDDDDEDDDGSSGDNNNNNKQIMAELVSAGGVSENNKDEDCSSTSSGSLKSGSNTTARDASLSESGATRKDLPSPSDVWGEDREDQEWILLFDSLFKGKVNYRYEVVYNDILHKLRTSSRRGGEDETDRASVRSGSGSTSSAAKRAISAPPVRRATAPQMGKGATPSAAAAIAAGLPGLVTASSGTGNASRPLSRSGSVRKTPGAASAAQAAASGAIDEEQFMTMFEDVPKVKIYSGKDVDDVMTRIRETVGNTSNDWDKRIEGLRQLRAVLLEGAARSFPDEFFPQLRSMEPAMQASVRDLRSQVVREACVTTACMAQELKHKFDHCAEALLPPLINLIPNTVKIMSTSGTVCIRFLIQNVHSPRLIPILTMSMSHKSKEIRRAVCEFLAHLLNTWPTAPMERHLSALSDALRRGVSDADPEARIFSRKAYWAFANHFPVQADQLLNSLDASYKRGLMSAGGGDTATSSAASSSSTLPSRGGAAKTSTAVTPGFRSNVATSNNAWGSMYAERPPSSAASASLTGGSVENISRLPMPSSARKPSANRMPSSASSYAGSETDGPTSLTPRHNNLRSTSTTDLQAAQRAKARQQYAEWSRMKSALTPSTGSRSRKPSESGGAYGTADRLGRSRGRKPVSHSQPGSRSGSPSSRLNYITTNMALMGCGPGDSATMGRLRPGMGMGVGGVSANRSRLPARSAATSRETSPGPRPFRARYLSSGDGGRTAFGFRQPVMAQKMLQHSREAENALESALMDSPASLRPRRSRTGELAFDDGPSDESETSSLCSDRSYESFARRTADYDVNEILRLCASGHWVDRKEGLVGLQGLLRSPRRQLSTSDLRRVTESFTKMFADPHTKVFTLFLDTVTELVSCYGGEEIARVGWLYVLLTRLLSKMGGDLLNSVVGKINRLLDLVRDTFSPEAQFAVLVRYLGDGAHTPNSKCKLATLTYLRRLLGQGSGHTAAFGVGIGGSNNSEETLTAIRKLLQWSSDMKSLEVARVSRAALVAMFNHSPPAFTMLMQQLSKREEEAIQAILDSPRRASVDSAGSASPSALFPGRTAPIGLTPLRQASTSSPTTTGLLSPQPSLGLGRLGREDTENLNPEDDFYASLQRTTAEIESSFKAMNLGGGVGGVGSVGGGGRGVGDAVGGGGASGGAATSKDSGISQLSLEDRGGHGESPELDAVDSGPHSISVIATPGGGGGLLTTRVRDILASLSERGSTKALGLAHLSKLLSRIEQERAQPRGLSAEHADDERSLVLCFKQLLRILLEALKDDGASSPDMRVNSLRVLEELVANRSLAPQFEQYIELLLWQALEGYSDSHKDVSRAAEHLATTVGVQLNLDRVLSSINPLIGKGEFPANQLAIKMMTRVAEAQPSALTRLLATPTQQHLVDDVMQSLMQAYDSEESSVRKAAVFCMVALHNALGPDALQPYLATLSGSKLKLLHLYIKRNQQQQPPSGGGSGSGGSNAVSASSSPSPRASPGVQSFADFNNHHHRI